MLYFDVALAVTKHATVTWTSRYACFKGSIFSTTKRALLPNFYTHPVLTLIQNTDVWTQNMDGARWLRQLPGWLPVQMQAT